jgi:hypothetical protein
MESSRIRICWVCVAALLFAGVAALPLRAQDNVTISKSRLEELERKEKELQKLQGDLHKTKDENTQLKKQHQEDTAKIATIPVPAPLVVNHTSPPIANLPPLATGEVVNALDLANYYRVDRASADQRYLNHSFKVRGMVASFEKIITSRYYRVLFQSPDGQTKVMCNIYPPETYKGVFTASNGQEVVGLTRAESRVTLIRVGDAAEVSGECKGLEGSLVRMAGCVLVSAQTQAGK